MNFDWLNTELFSIGDFHFKIANLIGALIVMVVTFITLLILRRVIKHPKFKSDKTEQRRRHSIYLLIKYVILVISIVILFETLGFKVQLLLAGSAALLVGIGLGLQFIFSDFMSGIFLLVEGTIKVGEILEVDGLVGRVEEINLRNSEILTRDNVIVIVPNSKFVSDKVINWSKNHDSVRFEVEIGVAYGSDVHVVREILEECMVGLDSIETKPDPYVRFADFGESSLDFVLIFWTQESFAINDLKSDLRFKIYDQLNENKITIPFPQRDVHIHK